MPSVTTRKRALVTAVVLICLGALSATGYHFYIGSHLTAGLGAGRPPAILAELPADAPVLAYIDVAALRKLQDSPLFAILGLAGADPAEEKEYAAFVKDTGFDYTRDLNAVAISIWPENSAPVSKNTAANRVYAVAEGRFDQQKIKAYALRTGKVVMAGTTPIYDVPGDSDVSIRFLGPGRIAISSGMDLASVAGLNKNSSALAPGIDRVAGAPIFVAARMNALPDSLYSVLHGSPQLEALVRGIRELSLAGQPNGNQIQATIDAQCDSTQNAFELAAVLDSARIVGAMALTDPKTRHQITPEQAAFLNTLINEAKVSHQDTWIRLKVAITPEMLLAAAGAGSGTKSRPPDRRAQ